MNIANPRTCCCYAFSFEAQVQSSSFPFCSVIYHWTDRQTELWHRALYFPYDSMKDVTFNRKLI
jgi:hypothetical protein